MNRHQEHTDIGAGKVFAGGASIGAASNIAHDFHLNKVESKLTNNRTLRKFTEKLKPGDIIISGSVNKHSSGVAVEDLPKMAQKIVRKVSPKIKGSKIIIPNAASLNLFGGGSKYHASIYVGKGKIIQSAGDVGHAYLSHESVGQNMAAYRFKNATAKEAAQAVRTAKAISKRKVPYSSFAKQAYQGATNIFSPVGPSPAHVLKSSVCNTIPVRAYSKRFFTMQNAHTFASDLRKAPGLQAIARSDNIKRSVGLKALNVGGQAIKGVKWGVAAAAAYGAYKGGQVIFRRFGGHVVPIRTGGNRGK